MFFTNKKIYVYGDKHYAMIEKPRRSDRYALWRPVVKVLFVWVKVWGKKEFLLDDYGFESLLKLKLK